MMFTPIEWLVFAAVAGACFTLSVAWQLNRSGATTEPALGLQWRNELELLGDNAGQSGGMSTESWDVWLHRVVKQANVGLSLATFLLMAGCLSVLGGVAAAMLGLPEPGQVLVGLMVFACCVLAIWSAFRSQRKKFNEQFPVALELVARAVQAGESFESAVRVAQNASASPMREELDQTLALMRMGVAPEVAVQTLAQRNPTIDVKIFAHTIAVHHQLGGRLGQTLDRLASVIRERGEYMERLKSATSLGRFAAMMICTIGLLALTYLIVCQPDYLHRLWESPLGQRMALYAIVSEVVGIVWVIITLNADL